jgi:elongation factor Ts
MVKVNKDKAKKAKIDMAKVKELRQATGSGVMEAKRALEAAGGEMKKAKQILRQQGLEKAAKRADKATGEGQIYAYIHNGGRIGAMIELRCETDFVARSDDFQQLCKELALQVASMDPKDEKELLQQDYIRDSSKKVADLIKETAAKVKENIVLAKISRMEL